MRSVLFGVLIADHLQNVAVRFQKFGDLYRDWLDEYLRVVNGELQVHMAEIAASEPLHDMQGLAMRMAERIELASIVEPDGVHDQRLVLPLPDRISHP